MHEGQTNLLRQAGVVYCRKCGLYVGHMVEVQVDGTVMTALAVGGAVLLRGAGWCQFCKAPFFWESSRKRLLVRRAKVV